MKEVILAALLSVVALSAVARADSFESKCPDVAPCARAVSELTGQKYVFDNEIKGPFHGTRNLELTRENADLLFTNMLNAGGFARVPLGEPGHYQIMRQRDARDGPLPLVECSRDRAPNLPNTWDLLTLRYKATHPSIRDMDVATAPEIRTRQEHKAPEKRTNKTGKEAKNEQ